jgi:cell division protein FtsB
MAAGARVARSPAAGRRRPARRPAARRGASRIQWDRVGRIALTQTLFAILYSYLNPVIDFVQTYTGTSATKERLHEVLAENKRLHNRVRSADDPVVLAAKARAQGMIASGETPYIIQRSSQP